MKFILIISACIFVGLLVLLNSLNSQESAQECLQKGVAIINQLGGITNLETLGSLPRFPEVTPLTEDEFGNNLSEGIRLLEKALELDPSCQEAYFFLGTAYLSAKRNEDAIRMLNLSTVAQPQNTVAYDILFNIYIAQNNLNEARKLAEKFKANCPDQLGLYYFYLGRISLLEGKYNNSLAFLDQADKNGFDDKVTICFLRARAYHGLEDKKEAIKALNEAITINPDLRDEVRGLKEELNLSGAIGVTPEPVD